MHSIYQVISKSKGDNFKYTECVIFKWFTAHILEPLTFSKHLTFAASAVLKVDVVTRFRY